MGLIDRVIEMRRKFVLSLVFALLTWAGTAENSFAGQLEYRGSTFWYSPNQILYDPPYLYSVFVYGLMIHEIGDSIQLKSQLYLSGYSTRVVKSGNLLFVASEHGGMKVIDVSDPSLPQIVSTFNPAGAVSDVAVHDSIAYLACRGAGIFSVDISSPQSPRTMGHVATLEHQGEICHLGISPDGKTVMSNHGWGASLPTLCFFDVTNPQSPQLASTKMVQNNPKFFSFQGDTAFVAAWFTNDWLMSLDISNPLSPVELDKVYLTGQLCDMSMENSKAVVSIVNKLQFYDFSDPADIHLAQSEPIAGSNLVSQAVGQLVVYKGQIPEEIRYYDTTGPILQLNSSLRVGNGWVQNGLIAGNYALVQCKNLQILGLTEAVPTSVVDTFALSGSGLLAVGSNLALATIGYSNDRVLLDNTNPNHINARDTLYLREVQKVVIRNNFIFVGENYSVAIYDATDPSNVKFVNRIATSDVQDLEVENGLAYVAGFQSLAVLDVSDPSEARPLSSSELGTIDIAVTSNILFCKVDSTILAYDMSDPSNPALRGSYTVDGNIWGSIVAHGMVVAFQSEKFSENANSVALPTVKLVDFSTMNAVALVGEFTIPETGSIDFDGRWLLFTSTRGSLLLSYQCCEGSTGNMDCDRAGIVDISDVTSLIDFLFISLTPLCCPAQGDLDQSGNTDIADLTQLIESLFITIVPLPTCSN